MDDRTMGGIQGISIVELSCNGIQHDLKQSKGNVTTASKGVCQMLETLFVKDHLIESIGLGKEKLHKFERILTDLRISNVEQSHCYVESV